MEKNFYQSPKMNNEPRNERSSIFTHIESAYEWCIYHKIISKRVSCEVCQDMMFTEHDTSYMNHYRFRCNNNLCGASRCVYSLTQFSTPQIPITEYLFILYKWAAKCFTYNIESNTLVSESTILRIKKKIYLFIKQENINYFKEKIGSDDNAIQIDETVIIKGKLIKNPSALKDEIKNSTWLVGAIEEKTRSLRIKIVPDRKLPTMKLFFDEFINKNTIVKSDGFKSYIGAVKHINGQHIIVNHEKGFKNSEGFTTNMIEGVWALIKYEINLRKGIRQSAIPNFLEEFIWRRENIKTKSKESLYNGFIALVMLFK